MNDLANSSYIDNPRRSAVHAKVVLVVDDSPESLSLISATLEQHGYNVLVALGGRQALSIVERIRPDIVLLDAMMPQMDGFEMVSELKKNPAFNDIPVIFMTGLSDPASIVRGLDCGGVDYLTKPVNMDELVARIKVHVRNLHQTSSAYHALDTAGQFLFYLSPGCKITWATPQTCALFARAKLGQDELNDVIAPQIFDWLQHKPPLNQKLVLRDVEHPLCVVLVSQSNGDDTLLKLQEIDSLSSDSLIREKLGLTQRESEVLYWISNGKTNREIGMILEMSPRTVNKHLEQIFPKLGVRNRTAAARLALKVLTD
jgi:DNA-binding NarL/FixJ family response regulator